MRKLEHFETFYYGYQTEGRGLTSTADLERDFRMRVPHYDEQLSGFLRGRDGEPALDIGCGYGNFLYYLRSKGFDRAIGVDLDPKQVALARSLNLDAHVSDAEAYLASAAAPGVISAFDLIEHLPKSDAVKLIELAHAKLQSGGLLIVQCPCADGFTGNHDLCNDLTHRWGATSNMLRQLLMAAGFEKVTVLDLTLAQFPQTLQARSRYAVRRLARKLAAPALKILGIKPPAIWSNSQIALAWKA